MMVFQLESFHYPLKGTTNFAESTSRVLIKFSLTFVELVFHYKLKHSLSLMTSARLCTKSRIRFCLRTQYDLLIRFP